MSKADSFIIDRSKRSKRRSILYFSLRAHFQSKYLSFFAKRADPIELQHSKQPTANQHPGIILNVWRENIETKGKTFCLKEIFTLKSNNNLYFYWSFLSLQMFAKLNLI